MNEYMAVNGQNLAVKEYLGQRVVTFREIDDHRERFLEGTDFFKITASEFRTAFGGMDTRQCMDVTLITETGYLMLVKSFTDDLAWKVQRELVRNYFNKRTEPPKVETPRKSVDELLKRVKERNAAIEVIRGMIERFTSAEYLIPLSDTLRMLYFDSVFDATDIKRAVERELPARS